MLIALGRSASDLDAMLGTVVGWLAEKILLSEARSAFDETVV